MRSATLFLFSCVIMYLILNSVPVGIHIRETPVKLKLDLPNTWEKPQEQSVDMFDYISNQWLEISVGEFTTSMKNVGEISFAMYEYECQLWKSGLFVKGVTIPPKF
ncbi:unnamed protein product [Arabidopsis lyrata]|uniref:Uncharacterized protein n=1 Tax=Arabidopsis lyrata subsp. lyrata TaxID=81972 RepID=D7KRV2_ARALL|nr:hypothetical protein ARALYDRAFT_894091 [Arabidopsis lyrata subsp. lyrata]CAH8257002.1 unnamed protein product [Arabidopsis lyrata]